MDEQAFSWEVEPVANPMDVNWQADEGDAWVNRVFAALGELTGDSSYGASRYGLDSFAEARFTPLSSDARSSMRVIPLERGIVVTIVGQEPLDDNEVAIWRTAIQKASSQTGKSHPSFRWAAVIGAIPDRVIREQALSRPASVADLQLRSGGIAHQELIPHPSILLGRKVPHSSWPIIVEGQSQGYDAWVALEAATARLHRLCALLSVAWSCGWTLRESPRDVRWGLPQVTDRSPHDNWLHFTFEPRAEPLLEIEVPDWVEGALRLLEGGGKKARMIGAALASHHQGLLLSEGSPSFAVIAFTASIEGVGKIKFPSAGNKSRFRQALAMVVEEADLETLTKVYYDRRSDTVHEGLLHGLELTFGLSGSPRVLNSQERHNFSWFIMRRLRLASERLLTRALSGDV
jgi:hypothetical protein